MSGRVPPRLTSAARLLGATVFIALMIEFLTQLSDPSQGVVANAAWLTLLGSSFVLVYGSAALALSPRYRLEVRALWTRWEAIGDGMSRSLGVLGGLMFSFASLYALFVVPSIVTVRYVRRFLDGRPVGAVGWSMTDGTVDPDPDPRP